MERAMEYAYKIYLTQSFSKAAEELYISQPALSAIIHKLELSLGTELFDRSTKPITLTESGIYYMQCAEKIISIEKDLKRYIDGLNSLEHGKISIGTSTYFCCNILPSLIQDFQKTYPNIKFNVIESNSTPELKKLLLRREIDFALSSNIYTEEEFASFLCGEEELILAVPKNHEINKLVEGKSIPYDEILTPERIKHHEAVKLVLFADEVFITIDKISDLYPRLILMFKEAGIQPQITMHLEQMTSCYYMASKNFGSTIIRASIIQFVKNTESLFFYRINSKYANRSSNFYFKKNAYLSMSMKKFREWIESKAEFHS